jgi:hypothetical protein
MLKNMKFITIFKPYCSTPIDTFSHFASVDARTTPVLLNAAPCTQPNSSVAAAAAATAAPAAGGGPASHGGGAALRPEDGELHPVVAQVGRPRARAGAPPDRAWTSAVKLLMLLCTALCVSLVMSL